MDSHDLTTMFQEMMRDGIKIVPRTEVMDDRFLEVLQRAVNRVLASVDRTATVTADRLCVIVTLDPKK